MIESASIVASISSCSDRVTAASSMPHEPELTAKTAERTSVEVVVVASDTIDPALETDPYQLRQVLPTQLRPALCKDLAGHPEEIGTIPVGARLHLLLHGLLQSGEDHVGPEPQQRIPLDQAMAELSKAGFKLNNPDTILDEIASSKGTSGMGVYEVIKKLEPKPEVIKPGAAWTPEKIEETFAGTGVGRKTIGQIIKDHELDHKTTHQKLKDQGIKAKDDDKIKELADRHDSTPIKILTIILTDKI